MSLSLLVGTTVALLSHIHDISVSFLSLNNACKCCEWKEYTATVMSTKSDSDFVLFLQSSQGLIIDRSLVY